MKTFDKIILSGTLIMMSLMVYASWEIFVLISKALAVCLGISAGTVVLLRGFVYAFQSSDFIHEKIYGMKMRVEVYFQEKEKTRQEQEATYKLAINNENRQKAFDQAGREGIYIKRMDDLSMGLLSKPNQPLLTEGEVEVEKGLPRMVHLEDHLDTTSVDLGRFFLGITYDNQPVYMDFREMIHILVVGTTGGGKSVFVNNLLTQLLFATALVEVDLIDFAGNTFENFGVDYADEMGPAEQIIHRWNDEMSRRKSLYKGMKTPEGYPILDLDTYNLYTSTPLPYSVLFIEEGLGMMRDSEIMDTSVRELVSRARKFGLMIIFVAQSAKSTVLDTEVRDNFKTRIMFQVIEKSLSRTIMPGFDSKLLGGVEGRGVLQFKLNRQVIQTPLVRPPLMLEAGAKANGVVHVPEQGILTLDNEVEVMDLSQFQMVEGLPVIPGDFGTAKARIAQFFKVCRSRNVDPDQIKDAAILKQLGLSLAGYHYDLVRKARLTEIDK